MDNRIRRAAVSPLPKYEEKHVDFEVPKFKSKSRRHKDSNNIERRVTYQPPAVRVSAYHFNLPAYFNFPFLFTGWPRDTIGGLYKTLFIFYSFNGYPSNFHVLDAIVHSYEYRRKIHQTKLSKFQLDVENFVWRKILSIENFVQYFNTKVR